MKNQFIKKGVAVLLSLVLLLSTLSSLAAVTVQAGSFVSGISDWSVVAVESYRAQYDKFNVCSDGDFRALTIGFLKFDISAVKGFVGSASLDVKVATAVEINNEAKVELYSVNPVKSGSHGLTDDNFHNIFGNEVTPNGTTNAERAKSYLGVYSENLKPISTVNISNISRVGTFLNLDVTNAVNDAIAKGYKELCVAFLNPRDYGGHQAKGTYGWSDLNVYYNTATLSVDSENTGGKVYPNDYKFSKDSYKFSNLNETISENYYTTMFGNEKGNELYKYVELDKNGNQQRHGHCYGMALTTAATVTGVPSVNSYLSWLGIPYTELRSVNKGTFNLETGISVSDYIKYGHIYQLSSKATIARNNNVDRLAALRSAVVNYINGGSPVIIDFFHVVNGNWKDGHTVFAIGIDGNDILINDSNEPTTIKKLTIGNDGTWKYSGGGWVWKSDDSIISYSTDVYTPYVGIVARIKIDGVNVPKTESQEVSGEKETYATGMKKIDENNLLVVDEDGNFEFTQSNSMFEINNFTEVGDEAANGTGAAYWLKDGDMITASNVSNETSTVKLVDVDSKVSATLTNEASAKIKVNDSVNELQIDSKDGEKIEFSFSSSTDETETVLTFSGFSNGKKISAFENGSETVVDGLSNVEVELEKNGEVVSGKKVIDATGTITVSYDKENGTNRLDVDYSQKTDDAGTANCNCICHRTGFAGFIYKIIRIFWKIFSVNQTCSCEAKHY